VRLAGIKQVAFAVLLAARPDAVPGQVLRIVCADVIQKLDFIFVRLSGKEWRNLVRPARQGMQGIVDQNQP
jgi:hypothetical protein